MKSWADFRIDIPAGRGGQVYTTCPECSAERKKKNATCLSVNVEEGIWNCHHCGWSGTLKAGGHRHELHWRKPQFRKPKPKPASDLPDRVIEWFAARGVSEAVLARNGITYGQTYMPQVEGWVDAVRFPYYRGEDLVNIKHRDDEKNFRMEVGCERILYGLNDMDPKAVIIVEGEIDKLSLEMAGFTSVVSVPDGAPSPETKDYASKFTFLDHDAISAVESWVIAVDADESGARLEDELARRFGRDKCYRVTWPEGCKDANEVLTRHGRQTLKECIEHAQAYPLKGVFSVSDLTDKVQHLYRHGWERGVSTGWGSVDDLYTVRPGEFTVITGIPGAGKSNWLDNLLVNLARLHGWGFGVFSPENQPLEDHLARLAEKWAGKPFGQGPTERMTRDELDNALNILNNHFHFILDDDDTGWTLDFILERAASLVFRHGIRGLVIDPWNEIEHQRPREITETEYISTALKRIRTFARHKGIHIWVVAHPAKLYREKDGDYPVPSLYDISGSAHWRNKADNGLTLWREYGYDRSSDVDLHVQKVRFKQVGKTGMVTLKFNKVTHTYRDPGEGEYLRAKYGY